MTRSVSFYPHPHPFMVVSLAMAVLVADSTIVNESTSRDGISTGPATNGDKKIAGNDAITSYIDDTFPTAQHSLNLVNLPDIDDDYERRPGIHDSGTIVKHADDIAASATTINTVNKHITDHGSTSVRVSDTSPSASGSTHIQESSHSSFEDLQ